MSELFQVSVPTVNEHVANIYEDGEAEPEATIRKFRIVQTEGNLEVSRLVDHYDLDVILAVGYRVRSHRGTQFRRWATERLKEGRSLGADYFDELLERIREIRASEKRFHQKIRDLYALSVDYDASTNETKEFFQVVRNKLHWAITGSTAAEIITEQRARDIRAQRVHNTQGPARTNGPFEGASQNPIKKSRGAVARAEEVPPIAGDVEEDGDLP